MKHINGILIALEIVLIVTIMILFIMALINRGNTIWGWSI